MKKGTDPFPSVVLFLMQIYDIQIKCKIILLKSESPTQPPRREGALYTALACLKRFITAYNINREGTTGYGLHGLRFLLSCS